MKYYERTTTRRGSVNRFGRIGFIQVKQYVKTNDIKPFNYAKEIKFSESDEAKKYLLHREKDIVYEEDIKILSRTWG